MRILQVAAGDFFSSYGGGQVYVRNIIEEMNRQHMYVDIISFVNNLNEIEYENFENNKLYKVGNLSFSEIKSLIKSINPDIIHVHSHKAEISIIGKELNIATIITAHHGGILCPGGTYMDTTDRICNKYISIQNCIGCCLRNVRTGLLWHPIIRSLSNESLLIIGHYLMKKPFIPLITPIGQIALQIYNKQKEWEDIIKFCTCIIAPSCSIKDIMINNGMEADKVILIPHGIPLPTKKFQYPEKTNIIKFFFVGRICYVKGIHIMLEAFNQIQNSSIELHIIGGAGNKAEKRYLKKLQNKYKSDGRIIWHGKIDTSLLLEYINEFHILIHPAIFLEIFGLNISEALSIGKPVIASRCGGAEMQIKEGENGWLVSPNNIQELREKIEYCIQNEDNLKYISQKCPSHVISIKEHINRIKKLYIDILNKDEKKNND